MPASLGSVTWTCPGCTTTSGAGKAINTAITSLAAGAVITYTVNASVTASSGSVTNTATVTPPPGVPNSGNSCHLVMARNGAAMGASTGVSFDPATGTCTATDTDVLPGETAIPTLSEWAMLLMLMMIAGMGAVQLRRRRV